MSPRSNLTNKFGELSNREKYQHSIGSNFSPRYATQVIRSAQQGVAVSYMDLLDEIRTTDGHLQSVLFKREIAVAGVPWEIRADVGVKKTKKNDRIVRVVSDALSECKNFCNSLAHLLGATYYGRTAVEFQWSRTGVGFVPVEAKEIHARRLNYGIQDFVLRLYPDGVSAHNVGSGTPLESITKGRVVAHTPRVVGTYPTREGLGQIAIWYCLFKRWTTRDWLAFAEMVGRPARVGTFGTGKRQDKSDGLPEATNEDKALLIEALDNWSSSNSVALPDTVRMQLIDNTASNGELHNKLATYCNEEISKAVLGETLTTESGNRGARSLGEVHNAQRIAIAKWDSLCLSETIRQQLIAPIVEYNFGSSAPIPHIVFAVEPESDLTQLANRFETLSRAGVEISQSYVRDLFSIPEPLEGESTLNTNRQIKVDTTSIADKTTPQE